MVNFVEAYKTGLNSAELAEKRKREIDSVFEELNAQLAEATQGKIHISIKKLPDSSIRMELQILNPTYHLAIAAENPLVNFNSQRELAKWEQDRAGYPCKITLASQAMYCEDKQGLEKALAALLSDPVVGETLRNLTNLPVAEQPKIE
jgi:hypothetical protein